MTDNDDYMIAKATGNTITELMWDRLQEGINANRRYRVKAVAGADDMEYDTTKVIWASDIFIYFTRESDGAWVYNKINTNPTTGITCNDNDLLYVTLNDTTTTVLTVYSADYTSMPTDDTGRILILGAVWNSMWYGNVIGGGGGGGWENPAVEILDMGGFAISNVGNVDGVDISAHIDAAEHPGLDALDDRDFKPNTSSTYGTVRPYFTSLGGMTGSGDSNYQDLIIFNSYVDASGGDINALTFDKSEKLIKHWLADQTDGTWGTPETLAYLSDITFGSLVEDTTPQLYSGGELDINNARINLNATAVTDGTATGIIINMTAGASVAFPNLVYIAADGDVELADANDSTKMPAIGIALETKSATQTVKVLIYGHVYYSTWAWTVSGGGETRLLYVSATAGGMTQTPPALTGDQVQVVATIVEDDYIIWNPSYVLVERN